MKTTKTTRSLIQKTIVGITIACFCSACSTQATISARENTTVVLTNSYNEAQYDGCFWIDRLWEEDWNQKKSRRNTLKLTRVRITPWQSFAAVASLGWWVPMYLEWELNGDKK
jgi:hypothetical protein